MLKYVFVLPFLSKRKELSVQSRFYIYCRFSGKNWSILGFFILSIVIIITSVAAGVEVPAYIRPFRDCPDCPDMVVIPAGTFMMGGSKEEIDRYNREASLVQRWMSIGPGSEQPQHEVVISRAFALAKYPVTRGEFAKFIHETGYNANTACYVRARGSRASSGGSWNQPGFKQGDRDPVVCVSWADANAYVDWLNKKIQSSAGTARAGLYRLPSEAEYEYAARGGTTTLRWWGDDIVGKGKTVCDGCGSPWDRQQPAPVGAYDANQYGVSDILGNVWEWTQDCWNKNYEGAPTDGSPWLTGDCKLRVMRGDSWQSGALLVRSASRSKTDQDSPNFGLGFRVAKSLQ
jgi:formylglycine-generating enzyme required for sulfatase activity